MRKHIQEKLVHIFFLIILFLFINAFDFKDNPPSGWYQQFLPNIGSSTITDITFLDSLTGYAIANVAFDTSYVLKTTNGGDNWNIIFRNFYKTTRTQFLNKDTGFVCGSYIYKTTNGGTNWIQVNDGGISSEDMYVLNNDTIWIVLSESLTGGVFRTTNGGANWVRQLGLGSDNPTHIYFYNKDIGFTAGGVLYKTTNGGVNWFNTNQTGFGQMHFVNETTGWKCYGPMQKTTDGGLNWVTQTLPLGNYILQSSIISFSALNKDTIWAGGGYVQYPNSTRRGMIYTTTNGGSTWLYQVPDTSIVVFRYNFLNFTDKLNGWAYGGLGGIRTKVGGDPLTGISNNTNLQLSSEYTLYQNYPNPFNPNTAIAYQISKGGVVNLKVYNIQGKEIAVLVNERKSSGSYEINFNAQNLTSGIYFYSLSIDNKIVETKKMMLVK
ncbi:MAG: T9SS type A sorting domain-containing protein [Ignavibacteria bacterium]|nr:T9SS type A sorting domain-containing protein [Ignavibacteria bacterium]